MDRLGTPRIILDKSGSLSNVTRHDYLPFGEELSGGSRTPQQGYTNSDNAREKFTGYERDTETGLDYAQARYYASVQGRFTSPDPYSGSMNTLDPQSFNRYSYVNNDPINSVDPTGMMLSDIGVYQTENPEVARKVERAEDQGIMNWVAARSGSTHREDPGHVSHGGVGQTGDNTSNSEDNSHIQAPTAQVDSAFIDPYSIKGDVKLNEVTFSIDKDSQAAKGIYESQDVFEVVLNLRLPKDTTGVNETVIYQGTTGIRRNSKGEIIRDTAEMRGGSRLDISKAKDNNYDMGKGIVKFKDVDLAGRSASAVFKLRAREYTQTYSNRIDVILEGQTRSGGFRTRISVIIIPR